MPISPRFRGTHAARRFPSNNNSLPCLTVFLKRRGHGLMVPSFAAAQEAHRRAPGPAPFGWVRDQKRLFSAGSHLIAGLRDGRLVALPVDCAWSPARRTLRLVGVAWSVVTAVRENVAPGRMGLVGRPRTRQERMVAWSAVGQRAPGRVSPAGKRKPQATQCHLGLRLRLVAPGALGLQVHAASSPPTLGVEAAVTVGQQAL